MSRCVFACMDDPEQNGSGLHLRCYSNIQAYLDLGYQVEIVQVTAAGARVPRVTGRIMQA